MRNLPLAIFLIAFAIATPAVADAVTSITHKDGSKTVIDAVAAKGGSTVTQYNRNGGVVSSRFVRAGAGSCAAHRQLIAKYVKAGSTVSGRC
ncbi:MAG: hypothetical protein K8H87_05740 [Pseudorhodoplanes sp.]|nr:MAG: hypothetical protein F9K38_06335 [Pseudorhodoplanes sp.]MBZ0139265.1 hypothetical protein [Pseudorhodoplanes sp.]